MSTFGPQFLSGRVDNIAFWSTELSAQDALELNGTEPINHSQLASLVHLFSADGDSDSSSSIIDVVGQTVSLTSGGSGSVTLVEDEGPLAP
jgi:hypothetical protein